MAEAQLSAGPFETDTAVGIGNHLSQEVPLAVGVVAAVEGIEAILRVPQGIVNLPHAVEVVGGEELGEVGVLIEMGVHLKESHLHQVVAEERLVDQLLHDVGVFEEQLHQPAVSHAGGDIVVVGFLCLTRQFGARQQRVLVVHVPLCALRGVHRDPELRITDDHLQQGRLHRHDAAGHGGADGRDAGAVGEHLRIAIHHASCYLAHLVLAKRCQVAPAAL